MIVAGKLGLYSMLRFHIGLLPAQARAAAPYLIALAVIGVLYGACLALVQRDAAADLGAPVVELHTGAYAEGRTGEFERLARAAALTKTLGLECHAGHGLTYANVQPIAALPDVRELNIGHYLIGEAILHGLPHAVRHMRHLIAAAQ